MGLKTVHFRQNPWGDEPLEKIVARFINAHFADALASVPQEIRETVPGFERSGRLSEDLFPEQLIRAASCAGISVFLHPAGHYTVQTWEN